MSFRTNLINIEKTESNVWNFHYNNDAVSLFNEIKNRVDFISDVFLSYQKDNEKYNKIIDEILENYDAVKSVSFKNNFIEILEILERLLEFTSNQYKELNVSEILLDFELREKILTGSKICEEESEFTSLVKAIIKLDELGENDDVEIESLGGNTVKVGDVVDDSLTEDEKKVDIDEEPKQSEVIEEEKPVIVEEKVNLSVEDDQISAEVEITNEQQLMNEIKEEEEFEEKSFIVEKKDEVNDDDEINEIIEKYFSYQDSDEMDLEERENILKRSLNSPRAKKYAKILLEIKKKGELEVYGMLSRQLFAKALTELSSFNIEPTPYSLSQSWVMWDIAKQLYYLQNPNESTTSYVLANPLDSEEKQQEIIDRHVGWIVFKEMLTGKLDNLLCKVQNSVYSKKIIDYMIDKPKEENGTLSSFKLADLGKTIRLAFA